MYASSVDELKVATEALERMPLEVYMARVKLFLERKVDRVPLFCLELPHGATTLIT